MSIQINWNQTVYDFCATYPGANQLLIQMGLAGLADEKMLNTLGKSITLENALKTKNIAQESLARALEAMIQKSESLDDADRLQVTGVLPCPVRIPMMEGIERFLDDKVELKKKTVVNLKAASMGVDWMLDSVKKETAEDIPDLFLSAGFDLFFDRALFGHHRDAGVFKDISPWKTYNQEFENKDMTLRDPRGQYALIGVVPAIFLINKEELGDLAVPTSWEELLEPAYQGRVSLPVGDFDLFNAILLNIHKLYGEEGVRKLSRSMLRSMHPAEMVKSHRTKDESPLVTIMPYFFTKMIVPGSPMQAIWPRDGAIISPIFMLSKRSKQQELQPLVDYFCSLEVAEILSYKGKFPSVHPNLDNQLGDNHPYLWLGWDYIESRDIGKLIRHCEEVFNNPERNEA
ncbi:ABC transporter substrate-binding protein [Clostridia bacterium]|nr:ABC transporter substrate-binding protein [Clostridia bacterium]